MNPRSGSRGGGRRVRSLLSAHNSHTRSPRRCCRRAQICDRPGATRSHAHRLLLPISGCWPANSSSASTAGLQRMSSASANSGHGDRGAETSHLEPHPRDLACARQHRVTRTAVRSRIYRRGRWRPADETARTCTSLKGTRARGAIWTWSRASRGMPQVKPSIARPAASAGPVRGPGYLVCRRGSTPSPPGPVRIHSQMPGRAHLAAVNPA